MLDRLPSDEFDAMAWVKPKHSRNQVDRAGDAARYYVANGKSRESDEGFLDVISNWRASHSYVLNSFQGLLRRHAQRIDETAIVAQRLKRFDSIIGKLERMATLELSQMQDIAGCRAIVGKLDDVYSLQESLETAKVGHKLLRPKDYIAEPKNDGYRSVHLIFKYAGREKTLPYDKQQVEIQLRTELQHVWATTVEAVDAFTDQALKSNHGNPDWQRFFALMGSVIALREESQTVLGTPDTLGGLRQELKQLVRSLNVVDTISAFRATADYSGSKDAYYYLMRLDPSKRKLAVRKYTAEQSALAAEDYLLTERDAASTGEIVVLVSAESLADLKKAYPNYFPDMGRFLSLLRGALQA